MAYQAFAKVRKVVSFFAQPREEGTQAVDKGKQWVKAVICLATLAVSVLCFGPSAQAGPNPDNAADSITCPIQFRAVTSTTCRATCRLSATCSTC